jgi:hypothetical protein
VDLARSTEGSEVGYEQGGEYLVEEEGEQECTAGQNTVE